MGCVGPVTRITWTDGYGQVHLEIHARRAKTEKKCVGKRPLVGLRRESLLT